MRRSKWCVLAAMTCLMLAPALAAPAAAQGIWPERAENLQVLPEDFSREGLRSMMQGFSRALGVRCSHCHVGEDGQPLRTFDFASDDNPNKDRARAMLNMLGVINEELGEIEPSGPERVNMWCHTCHNGKPRPQTLEEALTEAYEADGGEAAVQRFVELRSRYYGGNQYDFTSANVDRFGGGLYQQGDTATALAFFELNAEHHPDRVEVWWSLGVIAEAQGRVDDAIGHFERALQLAPDNDRIAERLAALRGG